MEGKTAKLLEESPVGDYLVTAIAIGKKYRPPPPSLFAGCWKFVAVSVKLFAKTTFS